MAYDIVAPSPPDSLMIEPELMNIPAPIVAEIAMPAQ